MLYESEYVKDDFVITIDTDSVVGNSIINTNYGDFLIEDLWEKSIEKHEYKEGKFIGYLPAYKAPSFNTQKEKIEMNNINFIMKHKVNKRMYKIKIDKKEVIVTEDHSIIVKRNNDYISVKPKNILKTDKIIKLIIRDCRKMSKIFNFIECSDFEIEDLGIQEIDVYDIEINNNHNFFANNILVHNSLFLDLYEFIKAQGLLEQWESLDDNERIEYCKKISSCVCDYVNTNSYEKTQIRDFNSQEHEYKISFKQEIVAKSGLFVAKKKYCLYIVDNEGVKPLDPLKVTGLEVVRSDTPIAVKPYLRSILIDILEDMTDEELKDKIYEYKNSLMSAVPEEIASNIGVHNINEYINSDGEYKKGTPRHLKGAAALKMLSESLGLQDKIEEIKEGEKSKVVYLKQNKWNIETLAFNNWIPEFTEAGLEIDYDKMIEKTFIEKVKMFLVPMKKEYLLEKTSDVFNDFFC